MNAESLSKKLNGCEYRDEVSTEVANEAKERGLVIVFGASDDLIEFRGAIYDEIDAYEGTHFIIATPGTEIQVDEDEETYSTFACFVRGLCGCCLWFG